VDDVLPAEVWQLQLPFGNFSYRSWIRQNSAALKVDDVFLLKFGNFSYRLATSATVAGFARIQPR